MKKAPIPGIPDGAFLTFGAAAARRTGAATSSRPCPAERAAATRHDAFFDRGTGRVERILDTRLLLLHLDLGRRADPDDRDAADQLCEPLLELLAVVVRGGVLDLRPDLLDAALDVGLLAGPVDERRVVLVDHDPLAAPEVLQGDVLELHAELLGDELA